MEDIKRDLARKKLVRQTDGLFHVPLLCGAKENDELTFVNRKKLMKFFGPYRVRLAAGKVVYELDLKREGELRRRDVAKRRRELLKQAFPDQSE